MSFDNQFLVSGTQHGLAKRITGGLAQNATQTVTSDNWTADVVTTPTTRTIKVCADQPPEDGEGLITEAPASGIPTTPPNPAETNNCAEITVNIKPKAVTLETAAGQSTAFGAYTVIDYADIAKLRWSIIGPTPTACSGKLGTADWQTGSRATESHTVTGNPSCTHRQAGMTAGAWASVFLFPYASIF